MQQICYHCFLPTFLCYYCFLPTFLCYYCFCPPFFIVIVFLAHLSLLLCFLPTFIYCHFFAQLSLLLLLFFAHLSVIILFLPTILLLLFFANFFFCPPFFVVIVYILHVDLLRLLGGVGGVVQPLLGSLLLAAQAGHFPLEHGDPLSPDPRHPALLSRCMANTSSTLFCCKIKPLSIETIGTRPTLPVADFIYCMVTEHTRRLHWAAFRPQLSSKHDETANLSRGGGGWAELYWHTVPVQLESERNVSHNK